MASIENRSRYVVSVQNRDALTKTFAFNREAALKQYIADLKAQGFKPKLSRTNDAYVVRMYPDEDKAWWIYVEPRGIADMVIEGLSDTPELIEVEGNEVHLIEDKTNG